MSKRKLLELVRDGHVDGWDDPRMPTLRGLRRRGYPPEAIRAFCAHIGVARVNGTHEIELLESFVRTHHNRHALRRMAVLDPVELVIDNWPEGLIDERPAINNPEDESAGTRMVPFSGKLWIERGDFMVDPPKKFFRLAPGREVRLRAGYLITCTDVETAADGELQRIHCSYDPETAGGQAPDGRKVKATIHWVSAQHALDGTVMLYDRLFTDPFPGADGADPLASLNPASREVRTGCRLEPALADTPPGQVVQFERLGYFAQDGKDPLTFHRTVGLRDEWAAIPTPAIPPALTQQRRPEGHAHVLGAPGESRTPDLLIRSQTLYPAELRGATAVQCTPTSHRPPLFFQRGSFVRLALCQVGAPVIATGSRTTTGISRSVFDS